jgi:hypothetical protein
LQATTDYPVRAPGIFLRVLKSRWGVWLAALRLGQGRRREQQRSGKLVQFLYWLDSLSELASQIPACHFELALTGSAHEQQQAKKGNCHATR